MERTSDGPIKGFLRWVVSNMAWEASAAGITRVGATLGIGGAIGGLGYASGEWLGVAFVVAIGVLLVGLAYVLARGSSGSPPGPVVHIRGGDGGAAHGDFALGGNAGGVATAVGDNAEVRAEGGKGHSLRDVYDLRSATEGRPVEELLLLDGFDPSDPMLDDRPGSGGSDGEDGLPGRLMLSYAEIADDGSVKLHHEVFIPADDPRAAEIHARDGWKRPDPPLMPEEPLE